MSTAEKTSKAGIAFLLRVLRSRNYRLFFTSRKNDRPARLGEVLLPAGTGGLPRDSFALCYQTRTLDKSRLGRRYGQVTDPSLRQQMSDMLSLCFDID